MNAEPMPLADVLTNALAMASKAHADALAQAQRLEDDYRFGWQKRGQDKRRHIHTLAVLIEELTYYREALT